MSEIANTIWKILSVYIPNKEHEIAAQHLVSELVDLGVEEDDLIGMAKGHSVLQKVLAEYVDEIDQVEGDED